MSGDEFHTELSTHPRDARPVMWAAARKGETPEDKVGAGGGWGRREGGGGGHRAGATGSSPVLGGPGGPAPAGASGG